MPPSIGFVATTRGHNMAGWWDKSGHFHSEVFRPERTLDKGPSRIPFERRYGIGSFDRERSVQGEDLVHDWIEDILPELDLPAGYKLTPQDVTDLRMVIGLYPALQQVFRKKFNREPGVGTSQPKPVDPKPKPTDPPKEPPAQPIPETPGGLSNLDVRVEELRSLLTVPAAQGPGRVAAAWINSSVAGLLRDLAWPATRVFAIAALRLYRALLAHLEGRSKP